MSSFFVIKRDGSRSTFEIQRIINAVKKAAQAVNIQDNVFVIKSGSKFANRFSAVINMKSTSVKFSKSSKIN